MSTGFVWHEQYMWHDTGSAAGLLPAGGWVQPGLHYENAETKRRLRNLLEVTGLLDALQPIRPRLASIEELLRFHTPEYVRRIETASAERGGDAGELTPFGHGSYAIARLAVGGVIEALDAVLDGRVTNAYALVRPPGHHAERDRGRGFCIFSNVALAALHALAVRGLGRVAVVDWDVHHGNGTQSAFYADPRVLTISLHQDRNYPLDSGFLTETGDGPGEGFNLNVPLPPGSGHAAYLAALERVVEPALRRFRPELILVACGFDASLFDPLGRMLCTAETFRALAQGVQTLARELCGERLVLAHEGGYSANYVPACGLAVVEQLAGQRTGYVDPLGALAVTGLELLPHQEAVIDEAAQLAARLG